MAMRRAPHDAKRTETFKPQGTQLASRGKGSGSVRGSASRRKRLMVLADHFGTQYSFQGLSGRWITVFVASAEYGMSCEHYALKRARGLF